MRVSLVATPVWATKSPPLTVTYVGAWLRRLGHDVRLLDWNIELHHGADDATREFWDRTHLHKWQEDGRYADEIHPRIVGPTLSAVVDRVLAHDPQVVGFGVYSLQATMAMVREIKRRSPGVFVVCGGQVCERDFYGARLARDPLVGAVVMGEGEGPMGDLVAALGRGGDLPAIPGCLIHRDGGFQDCGDRAPIKDVNSLPWPMFDGLPLDWYTAAVEPPWEPSRCGTTLMSRGCVRKCDFCLQAEIWQTFRFRRGEDVYAEMEAMRERFGFRQYHFNDLLINGSPVQLERFCDLVIERGTPLPWGGNAIVGKTLNRRLLDKMVAAGCQFLGFGFESFSDEVLAAMGKKYGRDDVHRLLVDMKEVGMRFFSNLIIGHPAETRRHFAETVEFLVSHREYFTEPPTSSLLIVQENTPVHRAREHWGLHVEGRDALHWRKRDGTNDIEERKYRAQVLNGFYKSLWSRDIKITDMDREDLTIDAEAH